MSCNCDGCGKEFDCKELDENSICKDCKRCRCACHSEFDEVITCAHCPCKNVTRKQWEKT